MILNMRQYGVTKRQLMKLEGALALSRRSNKDIDPRVYRAMIAGLESQVQELKDELREFEELAEAQSLSLGSWDGLPQILIRGRVARGYTQKDLAEKVGVQPQQIQKYEASGYQSASLKRITEILAALQLDIRAEIPLRSDPGHSGSARTRAGS